MDAAYMKKTTRRQTGRAIQFSSVFAAIWRKTKKGVKNFSTARQTLWAMDGGLSPDRYYHGLRYY